MDDNDLQSLPLPIAFLRSLRYWDILGIAKFDDLAYEDTLVFLIQHLPKAHDLKDVETLLSQYLTEQTGSDKFTVDIRLLIKFLADDVFESWRAYLARNNSAAFTTSNSNTHARSRARGLMVRHHSTRVNSR